MQWDQHLARGPQRSSENKYGWWDLQPYPGYRKTLSPVPFFGCNLQPSSSQAKLNSHNWSLIFKLPWGWKSCATPVSSWPVATASLTLLNIPVVMWRALSWEAQQPKGSQGSGELHLRQMSKANQSDWKNRPRCCCSPDRCLLSDALHIVQPHLLEKHFADDLSHYCAKELKSPLKVFHLIVTFPAWWSSLTFSTLLSNAVHRDRETFTLPWRYPHRQIQDISGRQDIEKNLRQICCISFRFFHLWPMHWGRDGLSWLPTYVSSVEP